LLNFHIELVVSTVIFDLLGASLIVVSQTLGLPFGKFKSQHVCLTPKHSHVLHKLRIQLVNEKACLSKTLLFVYTLVIVFWYMKVIFHHCLFTSQFCSCCCSQLLVVRGVISLLKDCPLNPLFQNKVCGCHYKTIPV
jgi:hypothetical protein